jgi:F-type H+-transporting ATPase subunit gamma
MAGQVRVLRRRIRATRSMKKITKAMELVATSRIGKAQERVAASLPYANAITGVLTALASNTQDEHPLLSPRERVIRVGVLLITSDRGLCGGYNANAIRTAEELISKLRGEGKQVALYVIGRKGITYYRFRGREIAASWSGFSEQPRFTDAQKVGETLIEAFMRDAQEATPEGGVEGVDELHIVYTQFVSLMTQRSDAKVFAPMQRVRARGGGAARRAPAQVHQHADLRGVAGRGGQRVGGAPPGDEERDGQRGRHDQTADPGDELFPAGRDHPGNQ